MSGILRLRRTVDATDNSLRAMLRMAVSIGRDDKCHTLVLAPNPSDLMEVLAEIFPAAALMTGPDDQKVRFQNGATAYVRDFTFPPVALSTFPVATLVLCDLTAEQDPVEIAGVYNNNRLRYLFYRRADPAE